MRRGCFRREEAGGGHGVSGVGGGELSEPSGVVRVSTPILEEVVRGRRVDTDTEEDVRFGESLRGDEFPEELRRRGVDETISSAVHTIRCVGHESPSRRDVR